MNVDQIAAEARDKVRAYFNKPLWMPEVAQEVDKVLDIIKVAIKKALAQLRKEGSGRLTGRIASMQTTLMAIRTHAVNLQQQAVTVTHKQWATDIITLVDGNNLLSIPAAAAELSNRDYIAKNLHNINPETDFDAEGNLIRNPSVVVQNKWTVVKDTLGAYLKSDLYGSFLFPSDQYNQLMIVADCINAALDAAIKEKK